MMTFESWQYNSYTKLYESGTATEEYKSINKTINVSGIESTGVSKEDFRSIVYPSIKQKIDNRMKQYIKDNPDATKYDPEFVKELEKELNNLNELYHLSD